MNRFLIVSRFVVLSVGLLTVEGLIASCKSPTSDNDLPTEDWVVSAVVCHTADPTLANYLDIQFSGGVDTGSGFADDYSLTTNTNLATIVSVSSGTIVGAYFGVNDICTELHRQGLMDNATYQADEEFGHNLETILPLVLKGYRFMATPIVERMRTSKGFTSLIELFAKPWAKEMAFLMGVRQHGDWGGLAIMILGIPLAGLVGIVVAFPWLCLELLFMFVLWKTRRLSLTKNGVAGFRN